MKLLQLVLTKKWFDMIASGEKTEEYRELKPYWYCRLCDKIDPVETFGFDCLDLDGKPYLFRRFNHVLLHHGYGRWSKPMLFEIDLISIGKPRKEWCDGWEKDVFVIKLGRRVG